MLSKNEANTEGDRDRDGQIPDAITSTWVHPCLKIASLSRVCIVCNQMSPDGVRVPCLSLALCSSQPLPLESTRSTTICLDFNKWADFKFFSQASKKNRYL